MLDTVAGVSLAVPYLACFFSTFRGGFTTLSTYASLVDLTGTDLSIDCLMLAVSVFSFASLSSKQRYTTYDTTVTLISIRTTWIAHTGLSIVEMSPFFFFYYSDFVILNLLTIYISRHDSISCRCLFLNSRLQWNCHSVPVSSIRYGL